MKLEIIFSIAIIFTIMILMPPILSHAQTTEENLWKYDTNFYEKIQKMQNLQIDGVGGTFDSVLQTHPVIIITDDGQEDQTELALQDLGAQNIFKSYNLDFLNADVPINRITDLANYDFIYKLGDGQGDLASQGLTMSQAKVEHLMKF